MRDFSKDILLELAGSKSYDRGVAYVSEVGDLTVEQGTGTIRGTVTGTHPYRVELTPTRGSVA